MTGVKIGVMGKSRKRTMYYMYLKRSTFLHVFCKKQNIHNLEVKVGDFYL